MGIIVHNLAKVFAWTQNITLGQWVGSFTRLGEQVSAKERAGYTLKQKAIVPAVRHMGRIEPLHFASAKIEYLSIGHCLRWSVRNVVN